MKIAKSYSQSFQDLYALLVNEDKDPRSCFFIDCASSVPDLQSNSKLLLEKGWSGICVDVQDHSKEWKKYPNAKFIQVDALYVNWRDLIISKDGSKMVDYASIDVDSVTDVALMHLICSGIEFRCASIEHDSYRFGDKIRSSNRLLMKDMGYLLIKEDIVSKGCKYEDFFLHKSLESRIEDIKSKMDLWDWESIAREDLP